ncbi:EscU/YscU/HrcU family type III secretion system export apparatus switch protein [bacterium]|nr:EscU/YscU/HrcU family type III secretion system export apparatus switch protein [bacterium]
MKEPSRPAAVALRYDQEKDRAPRVVASGRGEVARRILELARLHNVPIREDADLLELLLALNLGAEIPEKLYVAVAEVLAFVYRLNQVTGLPGTDSRTVE